MSSRKTAEVRERELRLAVHRIERGRAHTKATNLSVASVAREAGVTPALIHNHYPEIAELIRVKRGASSRAQRDAKQDALKQERAKTAVLREELEELKGQIARLATLNEMLLVDNRSLKAAQSTGNVRPLRTKSN